MDPLCPPGWNIDDKQFAQWSDSESSHSSTSSEESEFEEDSVVEYEYLKVLQIKKTYKVILEEEDLID
jgi:hypothetical protein